METAIIVLATLAVGITAGFFIGRSSSAAYRRNKELEQELEEVRRQQSEYQQRVTEHFATTAKLFGDLTSDYLAVYKHLAQGAQQLTQGRVKAPAIDASGAELLQTGVVEAVTASPDTEAPEERPAQVNAAASKGKGEGEAASYEEETSSQSEDRSEAAEKASESVGEAEATKKQEGR